MGGEPIFQVRDPRPYVFWDSLAIASGHTDDTVNAVPIAFPTLSAPLCSCLNHHGQLNTSSNP